MNKIYKENLKSRNIKFDSSKKKLDIKEYVVRHDSLLLDYLINDLGYSRNNSKKLLAYKIISI